MIRPTLLLLAALLCCSCKDKPAIKMGPIYTTGPTLGPDKTLLANVITFHYAADQPEPVHLLLDGKRVKTVSIEGSGQWRIELKDGKLTISENGLLLEVPVASEGTLSSEVSTNESKQMVFDIAVGGTKVMRIECPHQVVDSPSAAPKAEPSARPESK